MKGKIKMKRINDKVVIAVDHGFGNIKTANFVIPTGVVECDDHPEMGGSVLCYSSKYYVIGEGHKEFTPDKMQDMDYYVLTLAAIARELRKEGMTSAKVHLAAGLPLTWVTQQKAEFKQYILQNDTADYTYKGVSYHIELVGADIFPQGFAAVADRLSTFKGMNMLCDIGNGTMNVMYINDKRPVTSKCFTDKFGTHQCTLAVRENIMRAHHTDIDESVINRVLRFGTADIDEEYLVTIRKTAEEYVRGVFRKLREHGYDPKQMKLCIVGGGGCLVRNFGDYDSQKVTIIDDICATAKGYEHLAAMNIRKAEAR